ncbi:hypothetical protein [Neobacillus drentensis]|uniref:hypothetical protein n=1 Tax=Neobacillus drentensis TaxID=220684 RepID=UPI002FFDFED3
MGIIDKFYEKKNVNYFINQPLFSEQIIMTNCYEDLQKNGWCDLINDSPDNLIDEFLGLKR